MALLPPLHAASNASGNNTVVLFRYIYLSARKIRLNCLILTAEPQTCPSHLLNDRAFEDFVAEVFRRHAGALFEYL